MTKEEFNKKTELLIEAHRRLIRRKNIPLPEYNGIFTRYAYPALTARHAPLFWRFDFNYESNPMLLERMGINAAFNSAAIEWNGKILLIVRVEGYDRKSFFAIAESHNGIDNFRFWDYPVELPETDIPSTNVYDMRLTKHEDGWIYGIFCAERKDKTNPDTAAAVAQAGIVRTRDFEHWERLRDLRTRSGQQRNVVLHPEFVDGKYALYTRPQDGFIDTGSGGGIGWGLTESMENAVIDQEIIIDPKAYHTIKEVKNGQGPAPIKTGQGWLHLAHGVRNTAAGLRYVLYMYMTSLEDPSRVIYQPAGYFLAPEEEERIGDVSNVVFSNGWVARSNGEVLIYYGSSDTRMHVAVSTLDQLLDYVMNTPPDALTSAGNVRIRKRMIERNLDTGIKFYEEE